MMDLAAAAAVLHGRLRGDPARFDRVVTDSRAAGPGALFVALKGERFDGHDFVPAALAQGAVGAVVGPRGAALATGNLVIVEDPLAALGELAAQWRARFHLPLVAVTGSSGKTTVKEMIAAIFAAHAGAGAVLATSGNLNNQIGLPLTLLRLREQHRYAVAEMGMNRFGEISYLTRIARPTVALITCAAAAHLEGVGSLEGVARAKGEVFEGLDAEGTAVINVDDAFAGYWRGLVGSRRVIGFGFAGDAQVRVRRWSEGAALELDTPAGGLAARLQVPGAHNARNAAAAAAAAFAVGVPGEAIRQGLESFAGVQGRLQRKTASGGAALIDDTYNANPDSAKAAIDVLAAQPGRRVLAFGDMRELGEKAPALHREIGGYAKARGVHALYAMGENAPALCEGFGAGARAFDSAEALAAALAPTLDEGTVVLVKGSRGMRMERVVAALGAPVANAH